MKERNNIFAKIYITLNVLLITTSCVSGNGYYNIITPKGITLREFNKRSYLVKKDAEAESSLTVISMVIADGKNPTIGDAMKDMLMKYKGDYLKNIYIEHTSYKFMIYLINLYDYRSWSITADVMRFDKDTSIKNATHSSNKNQL